MKKSILVMLVLLCTIHVMATGELSGKFSVSSSKTVQFSQGNLQFLCSGKSWRFASNQYDIIGSSNNQLAETYGGYVDLFGFGTDGYNGKWPWLTTVNGSDYAPGVTNITTSNYDWGKNMGSGWRTLTSSEWGYLLNSRTNATSLRGAACVNGVNGWVILPDNWSLPSGCTFNAGAANGYGSSYYTQKNNYTAATWNKMQTAGAVFLPAAGYRYSSTSTGGITSHMVTYVGSMGYYWSATGNADCCAYSMQMASNYCYMDGSGIQRYNGYAVRLVKDGSGSSTTYYTITVNSNNTAYGTVSGGGSYALNAYASLSATANNGYEFEQWNDGNTSTTRYVQVTGDATYTAQFGPKRYQLYVYIDGYCDDIMGTVSGSGQYTAGTNVIITATPNANTRFVKWYDGITTPSRTVTIGTSYQSYGAYFEGINSRTITGLSNNTTYGTVSGSGTFLYGEYKALIATPKPTYKFVNWDTGSTNSYLSFCVDGDVTHTANFAPAQLCTITVLSSNTAHGTVSGSGQFYEQEKDTLRAMPAAGYKFAGWYENNILKYTDNPYVITVTDDRTYTAVFTEATQYTITAVPDDATHGTVTGGGTYDEQRIVTLTAIPEHCYEFSRWSDGSFSANPRTLVVSGNQSYTAEFVSTEFTLSVVNWLNSTKGTTMGSGTYCLGDTITIEAIPNEGYRFSGWSGGCGNITDWEVNPCTFVSKYECSFIYAKFRKEETIASGYCGYPTLTDVTWTVNNFNELIFAGQGKTKYYSGGSNPPWADYISTIQKVIVEEGVTSLNQFYFYKAVNLTSVSLPSTLNMIDQQVFAGCTQLKSIDLPANLSVINSDAFKNVPLREITLPANLQYLGYHVFNACDSLLNVTSLNPRAPSCYYDETSTTLCGTGVFNLNAKTKGILHIPTCATESYVNAGYGDYFSTIEEFGPCIYHTISAVANDTAKGSVSGGGTYLQGVEAILTATPKGEYFFTQWNDGNTDNPRTVTVMSDSVFTAIFEKNMMLTVLSNNVEYGTVTGGGTYKENTTATLTATPNSGCAFDHWEKIENDLRQDGVFFENPLMINVGAIDITYIAYFKERDTGMESIEDRVCVFAHDGSVFAENSVDFEIFNLLGQNVTQLNGYLKGIYIVKTCSCIQKIVVP